MSSSEYSLHPKITLQQLTIHNIHIQSYQKKKSKTKVIGKVIAVLSGSCVFSYRFWLAHRWLSGHVHTGADPFGFVPKLERIGLAYTRDPIYLIQFGSAVRTRLDRIEQPYQFGSDPFMSRGDARIRSRPGADAKRGMFSLLNTRVSCTQ